MHAVRLTDGRVVGGGCRGAVLPASRAGWPLVLGSRGSVGSARLSDEQTPIARPQCLRHGGSPSCRMPGGGVSGSTRPARHEGSPHRPAERATRSRPRPRRCQRQRQWRCQWRCQRQSRQGQRRRPLGARAGRSRHRGSRAARQAHPSRRARFQAIALLLRDERARVRADETEPAPARRAAQAPRRHRDAPRQDRRPRCRAPGAARRGRRGLRRGARRSSARCSEGRGHRAGRRGGAAAPEAAAAAAAPGVVPQSVVSRQLANPFLAPDFSAARPSGPRTRRLASWELIGPLLSSFERAGAGSPRAWRCPPRRAGACRAAGS